MMIKQGRPSRNRQKKDLAMPGSNRATPKPKISILGPVLAADGLGKIAYNLYMCLQDRYDIKIFNVFEDIDSTSEMPYYYPLHAPLPLYPMSELSKGSVGDTLITTGVIATLPRSNGKPDPYSLAQYMPKTLGAKRRIAISMLESSRIPADWAAALNKYWTHVFVPSSYLVKAYRDSGVKIPILHVPLVMPQINFLFRDAELYAKRPSTPFIFGMVAHDTPRKNILPTIRAFKRAFPDEPDVRLIIKSRWGDSPERTREIKKEAGKDSRVFFSAESMSESEVRTFLNKIDCLLLPSSGEGFSFMPREALATGKLCIISSGHAHQVIIDEEGGIGLKIKETSPAWYPYVSKTPCGEQWDPDFDDLMTKLRDVRDNYSFFLSKAQEKKQTLSKYEIRQWADRYEKFFLDPDGPSGIIEWPDPNSIWKPEPPALVYDTSPQISLVKPMPDLSKSKIVIGASFYGNPDLTKQFAEEVVKTKGPFSLLLTEDGSPNQDENLRILNSIPGRTRVIANSSNEGFLKSQNAMMAAAFREGADIYVSLNSDVRLPDPDWLQKTLYHMFENRISIASPLCLERGEWLDRPQSLEYYGIINGGFINGASLFVSRHVAEDIGFFDERYGKGYYEDPDFCFRAQAAGYKQGVANYTWLRHECGATFKNSQSEWAWANQNLCVERWGYQNKPKIVFTCPWNLTDREAAGTTGMYYFLQHLSLHTNVWFFPSGPSIYYGETKNFLPALRGHKIVKDPTEEILAIKPDLIITGWWGSYPRLFETARTIGAKTCVYTGDVHFERERRSNAPGWETRMQEELGWYRQADAITVVSPADIGVLPLDIQRKAFVIPHRQARPPVLPCKPEDKVVGFLANWEHPPNSMGIRWFIDEVWGRVKSADPDVKLYLFGYDAKGVVKEFTGKRDVFYAGHVPNLTHVFANVDITICPMTVGAGMNAKVVDSINYKTPVVSVERVGKALGIKSLVSDSPKEQAGMIVKLLNDKDYYKEEAAKQMSELQAAYGYNVFFSGIDNLLQHLKLEVPHVR
jgi:glycosyltransferase involved in cell wall biosynthesis